MISKLRPVSRTLAPLLQARSPRVHHSPTATSITAAHPCHAFTTTPPLSKAPKTMPPRPKPPPEEDIEESFLKGSGPGGQKINKTNSAVQLKHIPTGIVVKSQATRSRSQNRAVARQLLAARLDVMARGDLSHAAQYGEFKRKKKASSAKKSRRKYRKLEEEKVAGAAVEGEEDIEEAEMLEQEKTVGESPGEGHHEMGKT
ncbi:peptide chain release factor-like protein [Xylariaceae sp. FL0016]|nr:peptide chain release factor-like protein [Xylariaceae sp. FL0016]